MMIAKYVEPSVLWRVIEPVREYFESELRFDGEFVQKSLILPMWGVLDFSKSWTPIVPYTLQKMRNAVVHSREQRESAAISPTRDNGLLINI